jgi:hypothetical protein
MRDSRADRFRAVCAASTGRPYLAAHATLSTTAPGYVVSIEESPHNPHGTTSFTTHTGLASHSTCTLRLTHDRVTGAAYDEGHDLDRCNDRRTYPRRHWLCAAGTRLIP